MYYQDLSTYYYCADIIFPNIFNVGWLDNNHIYNIGETDKIIVKKLEVILLNKSPCSSIVNEMRGVYECPFCGSDRIIINIDGEKILLGNSEVWVPAKEGHVYVAPSLIHHYINEHNYAPPQEFTDSLLNLNINEPFSGQALYDKLAEKYYNK